MRRSKIAVRVCEDRVDDKCGVSCDGNVVHGIMRKRVGDMFRVDCHDTVERLCDFIDLEQLQFRRIVWFCFQKPVNRQFGKHLPGDGICKRQLVYAVAFFRDNAGQRIGKKALNS